MVAVVAIVTVAGVTVELEDRQGLELEHLGLSWASEILQLQKSCHARPLLQNLTLLQCLRNVRE